jgi:hypothetical protein
MRSGPDRRPLRLWPPLAAALAAAPAIAGGFGDLDAGLFYDDNVSNAVQGSDRESDAALAIVLDGGWRWQLTENGSLTLIGSLPAAVFDEFDKLTNVDPGARLAWRQKIRLGADAPWYEVSVAGEIQEFESEIRSGVGSEAWFRFGVPATALWSFRLEAAWTSRDADSEAFTQDAAVFRFANDFHAGPSTRFAAAYQLRSGEFTSTATPPAIDPDSGPILAESTARVPDDAFPGKVAYRLDGIGQLLEVGWNQRLGGRSAFELRYGYRLTRSDGGLDYTNQIVRATYLYGF